MPRILLVEDNPETRRAAAEVLQRARYQVETCPEPRAAFARACAALPDLVILDVPAHQPRVGYQALNRLKQQEETQAIPVLLGVPTPSTLEPDRRALAERGVRVLPQPIGPTDLLLGVEDVLGPSPPEPAPHRSSARLPVRQEGRPPKQLLTLHRQAPVAPHATACRLCDAPIAGTVQDHLLVGQPGTTQLAAAICPRCGETLRRLVEVFGPELSFIVHERRQAIANLIGGPAARSARARAQDGNRPEPAARAPLAGGLERTRKHLTKEADRLAHTERARRSPG